MKHYLRLMGQLCSISNLYKTKFSAMLAVTTLFMCLIAAIQAPAQTGAAVNMEEIKPLQIGDTIPEELWHLPLTLWSAEENDTRTIQLSDYLGKPIVLEFWATWCGACIASFPRLHEIESRLVNQFALIPVTYQSISDVSGFYVKSPIKDEIGQSFNTVVDITLQNYFPRRTIPHTVVIDPTGVIRAITTPDHITEASLMEVINDRVGYMPLKRELKLERNLLSHSYPDVHTQGRILYSTLTGYTDGFVNAGGFELDTLAGIGRFYTTAQPILQLYTTAYLSLYDRYLVGTPNRRILDVKSPSNYLIHRDDSGRSTSLNLEWMKRHTYNYEILFPSSISEERLREKIRTDLDFYFGLTSRIELRRVECLVIKLKEEGSYPFVAKGRNEPMFVVNEYSFNTKPERQKYMGRSPNGAINYLRNKSINSFLSVLNGKSPASHYFKVLPPIFNEIDFDGKIDLDLPDNLYDLDSLKVSLLEQGLKLESEYREVEMFVLSDSMDELTGQFKLTSHGYVLINN